jgi:hypothetical protein
MRQYLSRFGERDSCPSDQCDEKKGSNEWKTSSQGCTTPCPDVTELLTLPALAVSNETIVSRVHSIRQAKTSSTRNWNSFQPEDW